MAGSRIQGITIEIEGNTTKLSKALSDVDRELNKTQSSLKDVERLLKFDPGNTELLRQQQQYLQQAIQLTQERLQRLNTIMQENGDSLPDDEYNALQREITATEQQLATYQQQAVQAGQASEEMGSDVEGAGDSADQAGGQMEEAGDAAEEAGEQAEDSGEGWSMIRQIIADLAKDAIKKAIDGLKQLGAVVKDSVQSAAEYGDEVLTLATKTGMTTDAVQELMYASELMDTDFSTIQKSIFKLTQNMDKATDRSSDTAAAFDRLHVAVIGKDGGLRNAQDVFYDVIDALGKIDSQTERDVVAFDLFGKSAQELNTLVAIGSDGMRGFAQEAHSAGAVMDGEALAALGGMDDGFQRMNQAVQVAQRNLALALAPAIIAVSETLAAMAADAEWQEIFGGIAKGVQSVLPDLIALAKQIFPALISILGKILPIVQTLFTSVNFQPILDATIECLDELAPVLAQFVVDLLPSIVDLTAASIPLITDIIALLKPLLEILIPALATVIQLLTNALTTFQQIVSNYVLPALEKLDGKTKGVGDTMRAWVKQQGEDRKWMVENWSIIEQTVTSKLQQVKQTLSNSWQMMVTTTASKFNEIKNKITQPIEAALSAVRGLVDKMRSAFTGLSFSLPRIKMPHLSVSGSWSFNPPRVPSFSVRWYRDAMQNGMILDNPTIFGAMNGRLLGAGEAGPEAIVGVNALRNMIRDAVGSTTNNNYGGVNVVVYGAPGQDVNELADIIEDRINAGIARRRAAF